MIANAKRVINRQKAVSRFSCERLFELMCPVKNCDWVPGWRDRCEVIYSQSGIAEPGCVFRISDQPYLMGSAVVVNTCFQPHQKIRYTAVNEHLTYHIQWNFEALPTSGCKIIVTRTWTALSTAGSTFLEDLEFSAGRPLLGLIDLAEYYLANGKMYVAETNT